jgi:hypothetical protein
MKTLHHGTIKNGKLIIYNQERWQKDLNYFEDKPIEVTISRKKVNRSNEQNRYYWGVVLNLIEEETGQNSHELHEIFRNNFLDYEENGLKRSKSTTELTTIEFMEYLTKIIRWAFDFLNLDIPSPNEVTL